MLSWALVVATYNRADVLRICVELALQQTRPPAQVIIVDASDDWTTSANEISPIVESHRDVSLIYLPALEKSLTVQRNQGIEHVTSDIVFMIDDDSLLYPDCASRIMNIYEEDGEETIAGIQTDVSNSPPVIIPDSITVKTRGTSHPRSRRVSSLHSLLMKHVLLFDLETAFIPYDGTYPDHLPSSTASTAKVRPSRLFSGYRMTYRTSAARKEPYNPILRSYCPGEDTDASYRISRHGSLVTAAGAYVYHHQSASGRIDRRKTETLSALNQAFLLRYNCATSRKSQRSYYQKMARRVVAELIKDMVTRRFAFPQLRGVLAAVRISRRVFEVDDTRLGEWYISAQLAILSNQNVPKL